MMSVDTTGLADIINRCLEISADGRFTSEQRLEFRRTGERLRKRLLRLLSARFNEGTQQVGDANREIRAVKAELSMSTASFAYTATMLASVAHLVGTTDALLSLTGDPIGLDGD